MVDNQHVHPLDRRRLRRSVQPARSNMPNFLQEDSAPQNPEHSNTWRLTNMTRHYYNQINDFRMGNWDRSERILDSLINGLRIQKANLDSKNAIMPLDWAPDTRQNSDTRSERTQEVLNLSDYWKQVEELQTQMKEFRQCFDLNRKQTETNSRAEREFIEVWIEAEQQRLPLIQQRSDALITDDRELHSRYEDSVSAIFCDLASKTSLPVEFICDLIDRLCKKPGLNAKILELIQTYP